jgi:outer membrane protein assembly factor BamA
MNLLKASATASTYVPVGATVLALSARGGQVFPLDTKSSTIAPRRFFMGGANTMRGYNEEDMIPEDQRAGLVADAAQCRQGGGDPSACNESSNRINGGMRPISTGGQAFVLGKAELRLTLRGNLEGALFTDFGNLWLDPKKVDLLSLRTSVGFGLRFITPIGPAALDVGFNVTPDDRLNEALYAVHFTVGLF